MPHRHTFHPLKTGGVLAAATALAVVAGPASSAQAATGSAAGSATTAAVRQVTTYRITAPAHVIGFDSAVAKAHGYVIKKDANGREYSVKASAAGLSSSAASAVLPAETKDGNCGDSFLEYTAMGSKQATVHTGFNLIGSTAYYYDWDVAVTDSAGTGTKEFYGYLDSDWSWSTMWLTVHSVTGYSYARVVNGYAYQYDGAICYSELPSAEITLK
ncbi:hypothetical protein [Actinospica robiniae]|uniref:hypothetical protein n=1 Tax=Actinospica robiniae TaxID=304901 RepID=UPI0003FCFCD1|nr:hypothetical protein [Actinospica robiniae]